jgi:hypothetical protein
MPIKDTFSYKARWDSVGLSCGTCRYQANDKDWPNKNRDYKCGLHDVTLRAELNPRGFIEGQWFCRDFEDNGKSYPASLKHFLEARETLPEKTLFGFYGEDGFLKEIPFSELEKYG